MNAIVTGSRAYGTPTRDSDVDLVVLVSRDDMDVLREVCDSDDREKVKKNDSDAGPNGEWGSASLRFGNLNLLCVTDPIAYEVWRQGTRTLVNESTDTGPIRRAVAIEFFDKLRHHYGLYDKRPTVLDAEEAVEEREKAAKRKGREVDRPKAKFRTSQRSEPDDDDEIPF